MARLLTAREATFAGHYARGANAKEAAIMIGVSQASAKQVGHRMIHRPRVLDEVARVKAQEAARVEGLVAEAIATGKGPKGPTAEEVRAREARMADADAVSAAAIAVGMLPRRVILYHRGDAKREPWLEGATLYEANPREVVEAAELVDLARRGKLARRRRGKAEVKRNPAAQGRAT